MVKNENTDTNWFHFSSPKEVKEDNIDSWDEAEYNCPLCYGPLYFAEAAYYCPTCGFSALEPKKS